MAAMVPPTRRGTQSRQAARGHARPLHGHPPGKRHALRRLPFPAGRARQHECSTTRCGRPCEIQCIDCHGTITAEATLRTSGPAAPEGRHRPIAKADARSANGYSSGRAIKLIQNSMVEKDLSWEVVQVKNTITPGNPHYNEKVGAREDRAVRRRRRICVGRRAGRRRARVCPREREHELHRLPLVVEHKLLRLPPAADGPT